MKKIFSLLCLIFFGLIILPQISLAACDLNKLSPIEYKEKNEVVKNAQLCLQELGFKISEATGYYGQETMKAIKSFYTSWYGSWSGLRLGNLGIQNLKKTFKSSENSGVFSMIKFSSSNEYKEYLKDNSSNNLNYGSGIIRTVDSFIAPTAPAPTGAEEKSSNSSLSAQTIDRYSSTNNQVLNIDEPDIVKTNGQTIFYKNYLRQTSNCPSGAMCDAKILVPVLGNSQVSIINALPISNLSLDSKINIPSNFYNAGNLLLSNNTLIVFENSKIKGYDVSNTKEPKEKWTIDLDEKTTIVNSRLKDGKIYLVTQSPTNNYKTCPISILKSNNNNLVIPCNDIYHPSFSMEIDSNFTAMSINPDDGKISNSLSFLGSSSSQIYVSENNLYVAYSYSENQLNFYLNFLKEKATDLFPSSLISKIEKISNYDISNASKISELQIEINKYYNSLDSDENLRATNEFNNRLTDYLKTHIRELEKTAIVKIGLNDFKINNTGIVPGKLLNQFSLDEYENNLRVAVTIGGTWNIFGAQTESVNDIYVLNEALNIAGTIKDLGITERIYSVRFIEKRGYLVTFRQTDPFYVLDLSNPASPQVKGQLKIPGYSSYLHPISDNIILGVGEENNKVKLSLFNVASPENPTEISKYNLDEYWTEVNSNHHAFLLDKTHNIFFIPASQGGYIFSYKNNELSLKKTSKDYNIDRAVYINDYLYMLGDNKVTVFDENTWEKVKELEIK
ncbi:MAG: beta-propeller domain-containing protein [Candidatus Pacebacteria bacterium]|nr:beta-propeller domain-containing protein [Candidatus Paceibacterota bacterium]